MSQFVIFFKNMYMCYISASRKQRNTRREKVLKPTKAIITFVYRLQDFNYCFYWHRVYIVASSYLHLKDERISHLQQKTCEMNKNLEGGVWRWFNSVHLTCFMQDFREGVVVIRPGSTSCEDVWLAYFECDWQTVCPISFHDFLSSGFLFPNCCPQAVSDMWNISHE